MGRFSNLFLTIALLSSVTFNVFQYGQIFYQKLNEEALINAAITSASDAQVLKNYIYDMKRGVGM